MNFYIVNGNEEMTKLCEPILPNDYNSRESNWELVAAVTDDGDILGIIGYVHTSVRIEITWLYVLPKERRHGVGTALVKSIIRAMFNAGDMLPVSAEIVVGDDYEMKENNIEYSITEFFESLENFDITSIIPCYRFSPIDRMSSEKFVSLSKRENSGIRRFIDCRSSMQIALLKELALSDEYMIMDFDLWKNSLLDDLCLCSVSENEIKACMFVKRENGDIHIDFLWGSNPANVLSVIGAFASKVSEDYYFSNITLIPQNETIENLVDELFPEHDDLKYVTLRYDWDYSLINIIDDEIINEIMS